MLRILFLLLIVMSSAAFAQTEAPPKAVKVDEFERAANGYVKMVMDSFYTELNNNPSSQGYIINYGTDREIRIRERQLRVSIQWRKYDASRITVVNGGFREEVKTELWMVPPGAENPAPAPSGERVESFDTITNGDLKARLDGFFVSLANKPGSKGYILNFGSPRWTARQQSLIKNFIETRKFDASKVIFKNGGADEKGRTEFWIIPAKDEKETKTKLFIVPPGAKPPVP